MLACAKRLALHGTQPHAEHSQQLSGSGLPPLCPCFVVVAMEERPRSVTLVVCVATVLNRGLGPFAQDLNAAEHRPTSTRPIRSGFGPNGYSCAVTFACGFCGDGPCEQSTGLPQTQTRSSLALQWQWSRAAGQLAALDGAGEVLGLPPRGHEQGGPSPPRWIGL